MQGGEWTIDVPMTSPEKRSRSADQRAAITKELSDIVISTHDLEFALRQQVPKG